MEQWKIAKTITSRKIKKLKIAKERATHAKLLSNYINILTPMSIFRLIWHIIPKSSKMKAEQFCLPIQLLRKTQ